MRRYKYIILGAGPSGLTFAHSLKSLGEESLLVIEANPSAGGLCRSEQVDGSPLDIGGGHFLDVKRREVLDMIFRFMPESEWQRYDRITKIKIRGSELDYPIEANLWQLPVEDRLDFLESIAQAGCVQGTEMPDSFEQWITWKLGQRIADEYMLPYNRKIWSIDLDQLGTYWLYKLPDVSFRETLKSCLQNQAQGSLPAHGVFLYPKKHGYGEVWRRMGDALGDQLLLSTPVMDIDVSTRTINGRFEAENIISTIPWTVWPAISNIPGPIAAECDKLRYSPIDVDYHAEAVNADAHWVYDPDPAVPHHRILCRHNFCPGGKGYWTETNSTRSLPASGWRHRNEYAYPLNTRSKPGAIKKILDWARPQDIIGLGRWGVWEHMNSDVAVADAMEATHKVVSAR